MYPFLLPVVIIFCQQFVTSLPPADLQAVSSVKIGLMSFQARRHSR